MKKELDDALCRDFPEIFRDRHGDKMATCMCWGFECKDGWEPLIRDLCEKLQKLARMEGCQPIAMQVKEKYGTLRFYVTNSTDIQKDVIAYAEIKSANICEVCGEWGELSEGSWLRSRCEIHQED